jgi:hypothetical protein
MSDLTHHVEATAESVTDMMLPAVDTREVASETDIEKINEKSFELYKEAGSVVNLASLLYDESSVSNGGWCRDQAICAALMIRICKFMVTVTQLSSVRNRADVVSALNRSILETAINLEFLLTAEDSKMFDKFVTSGLGPERELYDVIQSNIGNRGGAVLPIERRMLNSIDDVCRVSGLKVEEIDRKHGDWAGGVRARLKAIGREEHYAAMMRIPSHAVHGNWVDLYKNHLHHDEKTGRFSPNTYFGYVDERHLGPIAIVVLGAVVPYIKRFFSQIHEAGLIIARADDLLRRLTLVGEAHENLLNAADGKSGRQS